MLVLKLKRQIPKKKIVGNYKALTLILNIYNIS